MIIAANKYLGGATIKTGEVAGLSGQHRLQRDSDFLPSLGVAAVLILAKVLELYATNAI